jgi:hypothetical protein
MWIPFSDNGIQRKRSMNDIMRVAALGRIRRVSSAMKTPVWQTAGILCGTGHRCAARQARNRGWSRTR